MSAVDNVASVAGSVKNLAIGAGILVAFVGVFYFGNKIVAGVKKVAEVAGEAGEATASGAGYLFGVDSLNSESSLGTDLYDWLHSGSSYEDPAYIQEQQLKSCRVIYARNGQVNGQLCRDLIAQYGP